MLGQDMLLWSLCGEAAECPGKGVRRCIAVGAAEGMLTREE